MSDIDRFQENLRRLKAGEIKSAHIADLPADIARTKNVPSKIFINPDKVEKIEKLHKLKMDAKFINDINSVDAVVFYKEDANKINLIKKTGQNSTLVVGMRRFNGHFVVTGFVSEKTNYVKNLQKRGEVINIVGRTPLPSSLGPDGLVPAGAKISGVGNITTSPKDNSNIPENSEKVKGLSLDKNERKKKGRGFSL